MRLRTAGSERCLREMGPGAEVEDAAIAIAAMNRASDDDFTDAGHPVERIGARLRAARRRRGWSIAQLGEAAGVTRGFLSQLERDLTSVSVGTLVRLCSALDIRVGELFDPPAADVVRRAERPRIEYERRAVTEFLLTANSDGKLEVYDSLAEPGSDGGEPYTLRAAQSFIYILEGSIEFRLGDHSWKLEPGDSLTYAPTESHTWRNASQDQPARFVWAVIRDR